MHKGLRILIKTIQATVCSYPQATLTVIEQRHHYIDGKRIGIGIIMQKRLETISIKTVQTIVGTNPYRTLTVLTQIRNKTAGKTVG